MVENGGNDEGFSTGTGEPLKKIVAKTGRCQLDGPSGNMRQPKHQSNIQFMINLSH